MNIIIFQTLVVYPSEGGISRMSKTYFDFLSSYGYDIWFMSTVRGNRPILERQLIAEGSSMDEIHDSFCRQVKDYDINIMIYQNGISPYQNHILRWAKECGIIIIDVIHNTLRGMYGIGGHATLSKIRPVTLNKVVNKFINWFFILKYGQLYREQFDLSNSVVLLSNKFRQEITYFTGLSDFSKFTAIFNPLTLEPPKQVNSSKKKIVLHVALQNEQKRQDLLLSVWRIVEFKRPEWTLKIVGDGHLHDSLIRKANKMGLRHACFLGFQSPEQFYNEASIFCLTSAYESFGLVLVEAMAFGCVPMAFNSFETVTDIISDGEDGILVPPFDVEEYAQKLIMLMDDNLGRKEMAEKAVLKSKQFKPENIMPKWIDLIESLQNCITIYEV